MVSQVSGLSQQQISNLKKLKGMPDGEFLPRVTLAGNSMQKVDGK